MKLKAFFFTIIFVSISSIVSTPLVQAQTCVDGKLEPPSKQTRTYRNQQLGFSFQLPANYRAMALTRGGVEVLDPASYEWTQCIIRNREATEGKLAPVSIYLNPITFSERSLEAIIRTKYPWVSAAFKPTTVSNQPALTASYNEILSGSPITDFYFLTPDQKHLVRISGPEQGEVLSLALSTFTLK